jgi:photosystem II stability/assembly factor-like uncharacterized protein
MSFEQPAPDHEDTFIPNEGENGDLVYSFTTAPGFIPGEKGLVFAARGSGLYRSDDGGQTWQDALENVGLTEPLPITCAVLSPIFDQDGHAFAGAPGGIFRTTDGGGTWSALVFPSPPPTISTLAISPTFANDGTIFAGTMEDGVFISQDGGERWVAWNFGLLDLNVMCLAISPEFPHDETVFAGTETGILRSTNGGRAWREVDLPFGFEAVLSLAISPDFSANSTIYAGTETQGLWRSTDGGETWHRLAEDQLVDPINGIQLVGGQVLAITSAALWQSADEGTSWQDRLSGRDLSEEISALTAPQGTEPGSRILAGFIDGSVKAVSLT